MAWENPWRPSSGRKLQGAAGGPVSWTPPMPAPKCRFVFGVCSPSHCTLPSWPTWLWGCLLPPSQPLWWFTHHHLPPAPSLGSSLFTHSWGYLPIAGTVVDGHQGVSTHQWACMPRLWGPLLLRDPVQLSLVPQGTSYHVCHGEACTRSWQWRGHVPAKEAHTLGSSFRPWRTKGYPVAAAEIRKWQAGAACIMHAANYKHYYSNTAALTHHTPCVYTDTETHTHTQNKIKKIK